MKTPVVDRLPSAAPSAPTAAAAATALPLFQAALRRAGRGPQGDEPEAAPPAVPDLPLAQRAPAPEVGIASAVSTAAPAPAPRLPDAVAPAAEGRWQLELADASLPVQRLDVQRLASGLLQVVVHTVAQVLPTERLRQRLAARGHAGSFRGGPRDEP